MRQLKISKQITNRETRSLNNYLMNVSAMKEPFTSQEEEEWGQRLKSTDKEMAKEAQEEFVKRNLRFVISVAKQYQAQIAFSKNLELIDLISVGNEGLITAAERFDPSRGFKFISYAVWWIRQRIMQELSQHSRMIRLPMNQIGKQRKITDAKNEFQQKHSREPSWDEIEEQVAINELIKKGEDHRNKKAIDDLKETFFGRVSAAELMQKSSGVSSYDDFLTHDDSTTRKIDFVEDMNSEHLERDLEKQDIAFMVNNALTHLTQQERDVVTGLYGIGRKPMSFAELAMYFGVGKERIRQIKEKAFRKLKKNRALEKNVVS